MDLGTIVGVIMAFALIIWAIFAGGSFGAFVDIPSMVIVVGGTICTTLISNPMDKVKAIMGVTRKAMMHKSESPQKLIQELVSYAEIARRDGILSLEAQCKEIDDPFIVRGIQMAVDGTDPELIEQIMETELENLVERHEAGKALYDTLGKYAPAFGMIGTLIGLVAMLANMSDPSKIGGGMAVALLTTLYGAIISNVVFLPMADKLAKRSGEEIILKTIIIKGVMSIQSGDNPRVVEQKLKTFLPPSIRATEEAEAA
ncbi:motility protein A [Planctomycetales bacterium ZRK34]|nr:motility protein A [Planctomycetales bacterium ZRK34]